MAELTQLVNALTRPRLLLNAVRHGLADYRRERVLRRVLGETTLPGPRRAVAALLACEDMMETARRGADAGYSPARHIDVLVALISEARALASENAEAVVDGSNRATLTAIAAE